MLDVKVLRNTIVRICTDSECAQKFFETLQKLQIEGKVEYQHVFLYAIANVLQGTVWSHSGSRDGVERCGDPVMWELTHKTTPYFCIVLRLSY